MSVIEEGTTEEEFSDAVDSVIMRIYLSNVGKLLPMTTADLHADVELMLDYIEKWQADGRDQVDLRLASEICQRAESLTERLRLELMLLRSQRR